MGFFSDFVSDPVGTVGDTVGDVVGGAVDTVGNTIENAANDPLGTLIKVGTAIVAPELLPYVSAADALANGADPERVAMAYAAGQFGSEISSELSPELGATGANMAGSAASAAVQGRDPLAAAFMGGVNQTVSDLANSIPGFEDLNSAEKSLITSALTTSVKNELSTAMGGGATSKTASGAGGDMSALLALLGSSQAAPKEAPVVGEITPFDVAGELETNPFHKADTKTKMATGGSIDDLLALLQQRG